MIENQYTPTTKNNLAVETTQMIDKSNFSQEQYKSDLQSAYDCGYAQAKNNLGVDCISRKAAEDITWQDPSYTDPLNILTEVRDKIRELPSVTPQNQMYPLCEDCRTKMDEVRRAYDNAMKQESRWIPVSEKLPNDRDWYLGIFKEPDTGWINPLPFICDYVGRETKATTKEHWILRGFTDWDDYHIDYYFNLECVAWMPLPKSYSEVEE